ncbi:unnamed protein product, partial [Medioppia subpectinata]
AIKRSRLAFDRNTTRNVEFRKQQLKAIHSLLSENEEMFVDALELDFKKPKNEVIMNELEVTKNDLVYQLDNIDDYVKRHAVEKEGFSVADEPFLQYEPYGVVLVIGAWNYPVQLLFAPLVAAITAGNCALIKPSEMPRNTEHLIRELIPQYLDNDCYHVITGGPDVTTELLKHKFDYIFFTGSTTVGRIVYESAAKYLTPVTLELGGKSPVWMDETVENLDVAVRRLLWAKMINLGQTCIAPDYVITTSKFQTIFIGTAIKILNEFFGERPQESMSLARIINDRNFNRIQSLLSSTKDLEDKFIEPTIVADVPFDDSLMSEEIFGPILPVLIVRDANEAISFIRSRDKPLALYVFSSDKITIDKFVDRTSSGVFCANDAIVNLLLDGLPFGGVGPSGTGRYHGKWSFETFSHLKGSLIRSYNPEMEEITKNRYPPFSEEKTEIMKMSMKKELMN